MDITRFWEIFKVGLELNSKDDVRSAIMAGNYGQIKCTFPFFAYKNIWNLLFNIHFVTKSLKQDFMPNFSQINGSKWQKKAWKLYTITLIKLLLVTENQLPEFSEKLHLSRKKDVHHSNDYKPVHEMWLVSNPDR